MADKRISQLVDRGTIANNDVVPIVVSGASTTNKATISSIQTFMQGNLDLGVTSVGLSMPSAFVVSNSPVTSSGNISVTGAGTVAQYIRGDGSLADFPSGGGGGGASVNYYLNGSVSQGTIGGIAYREINRTPILGAGTDFVAIADGYLASFITDAGDPGLLEIPGGNWNFETYFSASSGGGTPTFYVELYKVNSGGTATLIASNSGTPELIAFGTTITPYFSTLAVPTTALAITDRLALRYYVARSGRTITLHTENSHLCQIITTFTTGLTALNGLTAQVQNFATGTSGTDFAISSSVSTHTFNLPDASATARGVVTTGTQTFAGYKIFTGTISANNDIQLATAGTASTTFIKNISGAGLTSVGSNGFGFNNSDNIYFSGSSKGGGIIAFSNTGNQTYTLQDASGTLAFTSQIPANPVGGTGTANIIPKFTGGSTLGDSSLQNVSNSISNLNPPSGQFAWQLNGNATTGQSFGALVVAGTNASDIAFAVRNTGGVTTLFEVQGDGNVGIGTNTPSNILEISTTSKGVSDRTGVNLTTSNSSAIDLGLPLVWSSNGTISNYATASIVGRRESATAGNYSGYLQFATTDSSGSLAQRLRIASTGQATFSSPNSIVTDGSSLNINIRTTTAFGADIGGTIGLGGLYNSTSGTEYGVIAGKKENATINNIAGYLAFYTRGGFTDPIERMRITSDAYLRMAASSGGIQFNGDTAAANALDDYEEGTWTPVIGGSGGESGQSYGGQTGYYTKVGRLVTATFRVVLSNKGTITGSAAIKGLPFTISATVSHGSGVTYFENLSTSWSYIFFMATGGETYATIDGIKSAAILTTRATTSDIGNSTQFNGSITYFA